MGRKSKDMELFEIAQIVETYSVRDEETNEKHLKYFILRYNSEYHFFVSIDGEPKRIASSPSAFFEKERSKWGK